MMRTAVLQGGGRGQIFAKRSRYARSTPRLRRRLANSSLADDFDQARGLEFLEVVGLRGAHLVLLVQRAARGRPGAGADLLEHLEAPRLGERAGDARELLLGKARGFCGGGSRGGDPSGADVPAANS